MRQKLIYFYLDYVNNFLTVGKMADYYGLTPEDTLTLIDIGRRYHEDHVASLKSDKPF